MSEDFILSNVLTANWEAPVHVKTLVTQKNTELGQGSTLLPHGKYGFNIATHIGDNLSDVNARRNYLKEYYQWHNLPSQLDQIHSNKVISEKVIDIDSKADGLYTQREKYVCSISTADCLPILLTDEKGSMVAALHAGWQGLYKGIIANALTTMNLQIGKKVNWLAYIGPCISRRNYEVDKGFKQKFLQQSSDFEASFEKVAKKEDKYLANLCEIAGLQLKQAGVEAIWTADICTFDDGQFYSYRKNADTGRFTSMIWLER